MNTIFILQKIIRASYIMLPRKDSKLIFVLCVPITNTRDQDEYSKANEITVVKELCKLTP